MRNLGRSVNRFFRRLGFEIRPVRRNGGVRALRALLPTKDRCIEFIGPAGVGKTTLLDQVVNRTAGAWYFRKDLNSAILNRTPDLIDSKIHWRLLFGKMNWLETAQISGLQKVQLLRYFSLVLLNDVKLRNSDLLKGVLLDEGLCQNFARQLLDLQESEFVCILFDRALVFLEPSDNETVVRQIRERAMAGGRLVTHHHGKTDEELAALTSGSTIVFEALAIKAQAAGVPLCIIRTNDPIESKIRVLLEFERRFLEE